MSSGASFPILPLDLPSMKQGYDDRASLAILAKNAYDSSPSSSTKSDLCDKLQILIDDLRDQIAALAEARAILGCGVI